MIITGFSLMLFLAMVGAGVDMATAHLAKERMQNACDAGVLGARQKMEGNVWAQSVEAEANKYFNFNFQKNSFGSRDIVFTVNQNPKDKAELIGHAAASVPTNIMRIFGYNEISITADCNAKRDLGNNDVMLVLDVTGSMNDAPSGGGASKISRLRSAAVSLYRALEDSNGSVTRFGIMPYSHTVNVARSLSNNDFLATQSYVHRERVCNWWGCTYQWKSKTVPIAESSWGKSWKSEEDNILAFRTSGNGCVEERSSVGENSSNGFDIIIRESVSEEDVDDRATSSSDNDLQFGRYDPSLQEGESQDGCPSEASRLAVYSTESSFQSAVNLATSRVTGGTYHDVGLLWGLRFLSGTGWFAADNPSAIRGVPVKRHIVFMTDGKLDTGSKLYSADGVQEYQGRVRGAGNLDGIHLERFRQICQLAKQQATVWIIALDVTDVDDIRPCATSASQFYISNGDDLDEVFKAIGQGIGNLRLTK